MLMPSFRYGFTLIELTFSLAFVSILSITIALITSNVVAIYQRGLTLKQVNTTGINLISDLRGAISNSSIKELSNLCSIIYTDNSTVAARDLCEKDNAHSFTTTTKTASVIIGKDTDQQFDIDKVPVFGAFCSGTYSYIWNSGYFFEPKLYRVNEQPASFTYAEADGTTHTLTDFRLLKIADPSRLVCVSSVLQYNDKNYIVSSVPSGQFDISDLNKYRPITEPPIDILLSKSILSLALYNFHIVRPAQNFITKNAFYSGSFILATIQGGINIKSQGDYCAPPDQYDIELFDYCAINKFNFAAQAIGE